MKTVSVAELKNRLNFYLEDIRRGEEFLISDRNKPIARIVPLTDANEFSEEELALAAAGILRLPMTPSLSKDFWTEPRPSVATKDAVKAVIDERKENRY
ncbi:MAG: type II toxin-antitoxin system prevent-host-death family antitoxin [Acidobacteriota bacterium]|nr:type II toxin-antitoxin system prevent-host-death family antitoxin [Acidobacteriota bacterium]